MHTDFVLHGLHCDYVDAQYFKNVVKALCLHTVRKSSSHSVVMTACTVPVMVKVFTCTCVKVIVCM